MAGAQAIRAGRVFVEAFVDQTRLERGLRAAEGRVKKFGDAVGAAGTKAMTAGALIAAPLIAAAKAFAVKGDAAAEMSQRVGMAVEPLSELTFAAGRAGASAEELETGLRNMQRTLADAARGAPAATRELAALGLTADQLAGLRVEDQFALIGERLSLIQDPGQRAASAMEIFGRAGTRLLPMLADGARGLDAMRAEARRLGLSMSEEDARAAAAFADAIDDLRASAKMLMFHIGGALAPVLQQVAERLTGAAVNAGAWVRENQAGIVAALKFGVGLAALGVALKIVGVIAGVVAGAMAALRKTIVLVTAAARGMKKAMLFLAAAKKPVIILALLALLPALALGAKALDHALDALSARLERAIKMPKVDTSAVERAAKEMQEALSITPEIEMPRTADVVNEMTEAVRAATAGAQAATDEEPVIPHPTDYAHVAGAGERAQDRLSAAGEFSPVALRGMFGGAFPPRTTGAIEETAANTRRLLDLARAGIRVFS